jgi:uncharacterized repeat protein (TIGR03803 family)
VDGDLKTAVTSYQKIAADKSAPRDVRSKALLHLAGFYEKLGQQRMAHIHPEPCFVTRPQPVRTAQCGGNQDTLCGPSYGCGVVFKVDPNGNKTVLYTFTGLADDSLACVTQPTDRPGLSHSRCEIMHLCTLPVPRTSSS